jgi:hypothetical protein
MRQRYRSALALAASFGLLLYPNLLQAGTVVLKQAFIEKYKNRATLTMRFKIDRAHDSPNSIGSDGDDGDLHMSGRAQQDVGLPLVAEIVNAAQGSQQPARTLVKQNKGNGQEISVTGAWRFWFEHPSATQQVQGNTVPAPADTNPAHVFEIHPITQVGNAGILKSFTPIPQFQPYDAKTAFGEYDKLRVTLQAMNATQVTLNANKAGHNYAEFVMELQGAPVKSDDDGRMVLAKVFDAEGNIAAKTLVRMVFVPGTPPAEKAKTLKKGDRLHVLGIPRVNLERISFLVSQNGNNSITTSLPYEMIIVAVLE